MLEQQLPPRLRSERNGWGFNLNELAGLLGCCSGHHLSRVERAERPPSGPLVIASHILFGRSVEHLFQSLYDTAEEHITREAYILLETLANDPSPKAELKRQLLTQIINAAIERQKQLNTYEKGTSL